MALSDYVIDWLDRRAKITPEKTAIIDRISGQTLTYADWNKAANRTANFLVGLGVQSGDRVAVYATNSLEYLHLWMACGKIGAILQNVNWRLAPRELELLINHAEPKVLFYSQEFVEPLSTMRDKLPSVRHFISIDADTGDPKMRIEDQADSFTANPNLQPDDPWVICYTGGTTGLPKGALLTHRNMAWNAINTVMGWDLNSSDVAILNSPLFHTGGLNVFTLPMISAGGTSILCKTFDVNEVFDLVEGGAATLFFGVPTMFVMMQQQPRWDTTDFSHLKMVISGGAPCPMPVFEKFWDKGVDFKTGYGLTEAGPNTFVLPQKDVRRKPGAVGFPLMHLDVQVRDPQGQVCAAGQVGELVIRGPHVVPGYWRNPEATQEAIREGWLHTGDLAVRDEEGYYTIVGRVKDMIISGGENIYPAEVESVMHGYPGIAEAALIGIPDEKWGEVGCAVVALKAGSPFEAEAFLTYLRENLARYKVPKRVEIVDTLPKTGPGKIDKKVLVAQFSPMAEQK